MTTKPSLLYLTGKNAENFNKAVEKSKKNVFNYKEVQENSLDKLRELSKLLTK